MARRSETVARLLEQYKAETAKELAGSFGYSNLMAAPRLVKICINSRVGGASSEPKMLDEAIETLTVISGQRAVPTKAKKSVAGFQIREGYSVGCRVTLRGNMMYEFFDRLVNIAMPRIRDFTGMSRRSFDGRGNYSLGLDDATVFPEVNPDNIQHGTGMDITMVTSTRNDEEAMAHLAALGFPFEREQE